MHSNLGQVNKDKKQIVRLLDVISKKTVILHLPKVSYTHWDQLPFGEKNESIIEQ